jgi:hypothetical protein
MARIDTYRRVIGDLLREYADYRPAGEIVMETVIDEARDHYELLAFGWQGKRRVHGCIIHIDIRDGKVWLQHDSTDANIAGLLVEKGIPPEDIVLGFQPEFLRQQSGFAVR